MKKIVLILSVAALALASCVKTSDVYTGSPDNRQITFAPLAQPVTKAGAVAIDGAFPVDYNFYISAFAVDGGHDYFNKAEYGRDGESGNTWSGILGNKKYWPLAPETLNFLAVTKPITTGGSPTVTFGAGDPPANYASQVVVVMDSNIPNSTDSDKQHDLMYAFARGAVTKDGNGLAYNGGSNVGMEFIHAQSWVNFTVKAANDATAGAGIVITGIQLNDAVYQGTATVTLANYSSKSSSLSATLAWDGTAYTTAAASAPDVDVPGISSVAVNSTSAIACGDGLMVVPNPNETESVLDPSFTSFTISYTLNGNAYSFEYTPAAADKRFEPAHKYNFNITFTLAEIKVDATVDNWTAGDSAVAIPSAS